jgi:hypothetical protein
VWALLPDRYTALRKALNGIPSSCPSLAEDDLALLSGVTRQLATMEGTIEKFLAKQRPDLDVPRMNRVVSNQMDKLQNLLSRIRSETGV